MAKVLKKWADQELANLRNRELFQAHGDKLNFINKVIIWVSWTYRQHRTWTMAQNSHLASTGCSQRHQIVARQRIDRQLAPRSLLSLSMITKSPCSSIRTLLTFSRSRLVNLELVWAMAWLPRTTRLLDSQLRHLMRGHHSVKGTIATLWMAIRHLQASSMPSFNSNTSMTLTRRWRKLTTTSWLPRIT